MKVEINRNNYHSISFEFNSDNLDGVPPLTKLWFAAKNIGRIKDIRLSLIVYFLTRDIVGNKLCLKGASIPSCLATAVKNSFNGTEIFLQEINNNPELISTKNEFNKFVCSPSINFNSEINNVEEKNNILCERHELGYRVFSSKLDSEILLDIRTNIDLWLAISDTHPQLMALIIIFLFSYDVIGVTDLVCDLGNDFGGNLVDVTILLKEVGANVLFKQS